MKLKFKNQDFQTTAKEAEPYLTKLHFIRNTTIRALRIGATSDKILPADPPYLPVLLIKCSFVR